MFGWFRRKAKCPLSPRLQRWIEYRSAWLVQRFGIKVVRNRLIVLPTPEFFPDVYRATEEDGRRLFATVCRHMDIDPRRIDLHFYQAGSQQAAAGEFDGQDTAGLYSARGARYLVQMAEQTLQEPMSLVAAAAHELCHTLLLGRRLMRPEEHDMEPVTDLATVFMGLGVFSANVAFKVDNYHYGAREGWQVRRQGYLIEDEYGYALAIFLSLRDEPRPEWDGLLRPNVRGALRQGLRWLNEIDEAEAVSRGERFLRVASSNGELEPVSHPIYKRAERQKRAAPIEIDPFTAGVVALTNGEFAWALDEFNGILAKTPNDIEALQHRALARLALNQCEEALADAQHCVRGDPDDTFSYFVRAQALHANGLFDLAIRDFDRVIADESSSIGSADRRFDALFRRGQAHAALGNAQAAIDDFTRVIRYAPNAAAAYAARAEQFAKLGDYDAAQRDRQEGENRDGPAPLAG